MSPHDALFRMAFGSAASAAGLLRALLPAALVACIQWETLQQVTPRFLDKGLGVHDADLVFTAMDVDGIHLHVFVVEHKSRLRGTRASHHHPTSLVSQPNSASPAHRLPSHGVETLLPR